MCNRGLRADVPRTSEENHTLKLKGLLHHPLRPGVTQVTSKQGDVTDSMSAIHRPSEEYRSSTSAVTDSNVSYSARSRRNGGRCHRLNVSYSSHLVTSHYPSETAQIIRDVTDSMSAIRLKQSVRRPNTGGPRATLKCATPKWPTEMSTTCV